MPKGKLMVASLFLASSTFIHAASPLEVRFICHDLIVTPANLAGFAGREEDQLLVSSQGHLQNPNHEMPWAPPDIPTTHWGTFFYVDSIFGDSFPLNFRVNIPNRDINGNGILDLLEFTQDVPNLQTTGTWTDPFSTDKGTFTARWNKAADSYTGSVRITFDFTNPGSFTNPFEILDYSAPFTSAVKQGSTISGPISLTRAGVPENKLNGDLSLRVEDGIVNLDSTALTNEVDGLFNWDPTAPLERDGNEFWTFINAWDGFPYGPPYDFHEWMVVVKDTNDTDADGTPDLIDTPSVAATPARLEIVKTAQGIQILIYGDIGRAYTLEEVTSLPNSQWLNPTAITLTANPHPVDLPAPSTPTFWRARFP
jgi:hypothetical protein